MNAADRANLVTALTADLQPTDTHSLYSEEGLDFGEDDGPGVTFHRGSVGDYTTIVRVDRPEVNGMTKSTFYVQTTDEDANTAWWSYTVDLAKGEH